DKLWALFCPWRRSRSNCSSLRFSPAGAGRARDGVILVGFPLYADALPVFLRHGRASPTCPIPGSWRREVPDASQHCLRSASGRRLRRHSHLARCELFLRTEGAHRGGCAGQCDDTGDSGSSIAQLYTPIASCVTTSVPYERSLRGSSLVLSWA